MKHINEFYLINESLDKAKKFIDKTLKTQGFEIYIDDSTKSLVVSVDELIKGGNEYTDIEKSIKDLVKKFKLKEDPMSNDDVVFLNENVSEYYTNVQLHEKATSAAQRRLFAIALQYKQGDITKDELTPEYSEQIIKLSELPESTLRKYAETEETDLPHYTNESITITSGAIDFMPYLNYCVNPLAKEELCKFWEMQGLSPEQIELAYENIMKVQHHIYTNFYLGNPGKSYIN